MQFYVRYSPTSILFSTFLVGRTLMFDFIIFSVPEWLWCYNALSPDQDKNHSISYVSIFWLLTLKVRDYFLYIDTTKIAHPKRSTITIPKDQLSICTNLLLNTQNLPCFPSKYSILSQYLFHWFYKKCIWSC